MSATKTLVTPRQASVSVPAIVSLVSAILSFLAGPVLGLILAVIAILSGLVGVILSLSPGIRGGLLSTLSILAGVVGIVAAIIKTLMWIF